MKTRARLIVLVAALFLAAGPRGWWATAAPAPHVAARTVNPAVAADRSPPLASLAAALSDAPTIVSAPQAEGNQQRDEGAPAEAPGDPEGARVEQTTMGTAPGATLVASFDGLGIGFTGPHGPSIGRNPSDNSLAVGPDHIVQTVNSRLAIFTKKGDRYDTTGEVLYGAVPNNTVFAGFTGTCEARNNGDTVVRYDQLADRWLVVMPIFRRAEARPDQPATWSGGDTVWVAPPGVAGQPGGATRLFVPPPAPPQPADAGGGRRGARGRGGRGQPEGDPPTGPYSMCYAVSVTSDPLGEYYRYEFLRPLFPDYPRPAVWPDGYYIPTSTGDDVIEKHVCAVDRNRMLAGEPAAEQCVVVDGANFLNTSDLEGTRLPPSGAPNIVMATGGAQLRGIVGDDGLYVWQFAVDWENPDNTNMTGPVKIPVAPYQYLCRGQLTSCVPQPGSERRL
ncbi:MAG: hypothetical protein PVJ51_06710, partial [Acidobacteriota bacterium]